MRAVLFAVLLPLAGSAQQLKFEVAAIKPVTLRSAGPSLAGLHVEGTRVDLGMMSLTTLILLAYKVEPFQITGPDFLPLTRFDIQAKMPDGATKAQVPEMLQTLLAERFGLKLRKETREQQVYALVVGQDGPKLKADARRFRCRGYSVRGSHRRSHCAYTDPQRSSRRMADHIEAQRPDCLRNKESRHDGIRAVHTELYRRADRRHDRT